VAPDNTLAVLAQDTHRKKTAVVVVVLARAANAVVVRHGILHNDLALN
jgi:hypothetical protein